MSKLQVSRKINVDLYAEDVFKDEEAGEVSSPAAGVDEAEVKRLIQSAKYGDALNQLLLAAPFNSKNQAIKDSIAALVMQVLLAVKTSEIDKVIDGLSTDLIDVLVKYIYRGFETPTDGSSGHLLVWHEKAFAKGGVGAIVRVLTDKKRL
ncbi:Actin-related protein 2/3 complex subunit 5 [Halotydeus destructor]|nr:Actin-related protein 2/3 complex subunit 5 [Halotydeus destructor]